LGENVIGDEGLGAGHKLAITHGRICLATTLLAGIAPVVAQTAVRTIAKNRQRIGEITVEHAVMIHHGSDTGTTQTGCTQGA
jgi:hypothetical protein